MATAVTAPPPGFVIQEPSGNVPPPPPGFEVVPQSGQQAPVAAAVPTTPEELGLIDRVSKLADETELVRQDIADKVERGDISTASGIFQSLGKVGGGLLGGIVGETVSSGIDVAGDVASALTPDFIENPLKRKAGEIGTSALNTVLESDAGKLGLEALQAGVGAWEDFKAENPETAGNIEAAVDIAAVAPAGKLIKLGDKIKIGKITQKQIEEAPSGAELRAASGKLFQSVKKSDLNLNQNTFFDFIADAEKVLIDEGLDEVLQPKLSRVFKKMSGRIGEDLGAQDLIKIRNLINVAVDSPDLPEKRLALILRDNFDDVIENSPGSEVWRKARAQYAKSRRTETVEELIERAAFSPSGVENGLRNEFRSLLKNKKRLRGFSKEEKAAMQRIVNGDFTENTLRKVSKFSGVGGTGVGAITSGVAGAVGVPAVAGGAGALARRRSVNAAETLRALTAGEVPELIQKTTVSVGSGAAPLAAISFARTEGEENEQ